MYNQPIFETQSHIDTEWFSFELKTQLNDQSWSHGLGSFWI